MDAGAEVAWPEQIDAGDVSALQSAMNKFYRDRTHFSPKRQTTRGPAIAKAGWINCGRRRSRRVWVFSTRTGAGRGRSRRPPYIDVQKEALFFVVTAWGENMTGATIDYGAWPAQRADYFSLSNLRNTLTRKYPGRQLEGRLRAGLEDLASHLAPYNITRGLVDAAWGLSRDTVYDFCAGHAATWWPGHGRLSAPAASRCASGCTSPATYRRGWRGGRPPRRRTGAVPGPNRARCDTC